MPISDWSSDVCSSDLVLSFERPLEAQDGNAASDKDMDGHLVAGPAAKEAVAIILHDNRSEERRGGKECVSTCSYRGSPEHKKKNKNRERQNQTRTYKHNNNRDGYSR